MLLDEPLSALDLKLRQHMRNELREIQKRVGITFIYITHDQGEALTMSDRVAVMSDGEILQIADGKTIYDSPATPFVASFVGENNPLPGRVTKVGKTGAVLETAFGQLRGGNPQGLKVGDRAILFVRPESIALGKGAADATISSQVAECCVRRQCQPHFHEGRGQERPDRNRRPAWRCGNPREGSKGCREL